MAEDPIKSFQSAFKDFLKKEQLENVYNQKKLVAKWEEIVGRTIASRTSGIFFKKNILFVKLSSAPLKQELQNSKSKFLELVNKEMGGEELSDVKFL